MQEGGNVFHLFEWHGGVGVFHFKFGETNIKSSILMKKITITITNDDDDQLLSYLQRTVPSFKFS